MATKSSGFLFSGIAGVAMQRVVLCLTLVRLRGKPLPPPETQGPDRSRQVLESAVRGNPPTSFGTEERL